MATEANYIKLVFFLTRWERVTLCTYFQNIMEENWVNVSIIDQFAALKNQ